MSLVLAYAIAIGGFTGCLIIAIRFACSLIIRPEIDKEFIDEN